MCDGNNSTPNLTNRFVIGAGDTYSVNATGGSKDAIVVSHSHTVNSHTHSVDINTNNNSHTHNHVFPGDDQLGFTANGNGGWSNRTTGSFGYDANSSTNGNGVIYRTSDDSHTHSHNVNGNTGSSSPGTNSQGSSGTDANLPPYYALCYIMKT